MRRDFEFRKELSTLPRPTNREVVDMLQILIDNMLPSDQMLTCINNVFPDSAEWVLKEAIEILKGGNENGKEND